MRCNDCLITLVRYPALLMEFNITIHVLIHKVIGIYELYVMVIRLSAEGFPGKIRLGPPDWILAGLVVLFILQFLPANTHKRIGKG